MAYLTTVPSLKELIELEREERAVGYARTEQLIGFRGRFHEGGGPQRARHLLGNAAAGADFHPRQVLHLVDRPLGVEHLAGAVREHPEQLDAFVFANGVQMLPVDPREGDRVDFGSGAAARQLRQQRQDVAGGRVAGGDIGNVDKAVLDGIEGTRRG